MIYCIDANATLNPCTKSTVGRHPCMSAGHRRGFLERVGMIFVVLSLLPSCVHLKPSEHGKIALAEKVAFESQIMWPEKRASSVAEFSKMMLAAAVVGGVGAAIGAPPPVTSAMPFGGTSQPIAYRADLVKLDAAARGWFEDELRKALKERLAQQPGLSVVPMDQANSILEIKVRKFGFITDQRADGTGVCASSDVQFILKDRNGKVLSGYGQLYPPPGMIWGPGGKDKLVTDAQLSSVSDVERHIRQLARGSVKWGFRFLNAHWDQP